MQRLQDDDVDDNLQHF